MLHFLNAYWFMLLLWDSLRLRAAVLTVVDALDISND